MAYRQVRTMDELRAHVAKRQLEAYADGAAFAVYWVTIRGILLVADPKELEKVVDRFNEEGVHTIEFAPARRDVFPFPCTICKEPMTGEARPAPTDRGPAHLGCADGTNPRLREASA